MDILIDPNEFLSALSLCLDFTEVGVQRHHKRVAYMATILAEEIGLSQEEKELVYLASIVHDIGISTWKEKKMLAKFDSTPPLEHCENGSQMVAGVDILRPIAKIILSHHDRFEGGNKSGFTGDEIPIAARIIHLVDRVDVLFKINGTHILVQKDNIVQEIEKLSGRTFDPVLVKSLKKLTERESFWLGLISSFDKNKRPIKNLNINEEDLRQIARMFATVIDKKSPFTYHHSHGVESTATYLATSLGIKDTISMEIAGLLHDLGKLSIPDEILEKPGPLSNDELAFMKQHTYFTFYILQEAGLRSPIPEWAAYHHEKLDGSGYPFHLDASQLSLGSRIMAVADVFTALREDRPYHQGMDKKNVDKIMYKMVANCALDKKIVQALFDNYDEINFKFNNL